MRAILDSSRAPPPYDWRAHTAPLPCRLAHIPLASLSRTTELPSHVPFAPSSCSYRLADPVPLAMSRALWSVSHVASPDLPSHAPLAPSLSCPPSSLRPPLTVSSILPLMSPSRHLAHIPLTSPSHRPALIPPHLECVAHAVSPDPPSHAPLVSSSPSRPPSSSRPLRAALPTLSLSRCLADPWHCLTRFRQGK